MCVCVGVGVCGCVCVGVLYVKLHNIRAQGITLCFKLAQFDEVTLILNAIYKDLSHPICFQIQFHCYG